MTTSLTPDTGTAPSPARGERTTSATSRRRALTWGSGKLGWRRLAFGEDQPRWVRPSAFSLVVASGFLYLWNLTNSGWANEFYAAAIQAGSKNWTAWFFGSLDAGNAITVDKPPAAFWIPGLLGRLFGFSSFTMLLPEALMGVASVALLYAAVKRVSGPAAGLIAGGALAATPVAALMFRFNNPDAMLTLCLVLAAYMTVRAIEKAGWRWLAGAGALLGLAFLTKMLAGLIVVPALALAYLWAAPTTLRRRIVHLLGALGGLVAVSGAYILAFTLTPTSVRPYMAGSQTNSFLELTFGYNGLSRIFGNRGGFGGAVRDRAADAGAAAGGGFADAGAAAGGFPGGTLAGGGPGSGGNSMFGGSAGLTRMFGSSFGTEISWLLPAALILLVAGLWFTRGAVRTDRVRASLIIWGGWTVLTAAVFSFMTGTVHPYYAIALAPGIAGVVGIGAAELWRGRAYWPSRIVLAVAVLGTSVWTAVLLGGYANWLPWLRVVIVVLGVLAAAGLLVRVDMLRAPRLQAGRFHLGAVALAVTAVLAGGLGTTAFTIATASVGHSGAIPTSGPSGSGGFGARGAAFTQFRDRTGAQADGGAQAGGQTGQAQGFGGGQGGPGGGAAASPELVALLQATTTKWSAATNGSNSAASLELASNTNVIAMGGFTGSDPYPSLDEFKAMVANGQVTYYIAGGGMGGGFGGQGRSDTSAITQWVEANFQAQTVGSTTVYKLVG